VGELVFSDGSYVTMAQINQLFASSPSASPAATPAMAPMDRASTASSTGEATTSSAVASSSSSPGVVSQTHEMDIPENAFALQVNPLIHAMASFSGTSLAADAALTITHKTEDGAMLHVAA
jgi:hypothetical protein